MTQLHDLSFILISRKYQSAQNIIVQHKKKWRIANNLKCNQELSHSKDIQVVLFARLKVKYTCKSKQNYADCHWDHNHSQCLIDVRHCDSGHSKAAIFDNKCTPKRTNKKLPQVLQVFLHKEKDKLSKKSAISHA